MVGLSNKDQEDISTMKKLQLSIYKNDLMKVQQSYSEINYRCINYRTHKDYQNKIIKTS